MGEFNLEAVLYECRLSGIGPIVETRRLMLTCVEEIKALEKQRALFLDNLREVKSRLMNLSNYVYERVDEADGIVEGRALDDFS